jgi:hypothetical protein
MRTVHLVAAITTTTTIMISPIPITIAPPRSDRPNEYHERKKAKRREKP